MYGKSKIYNSTNRFSSYLFEDSTAWAVHEINGIIGRVMEMNADPAGQHAGLPIFPDSSDMYFLQMKMERLCRPLLMLAFEEC